MYEFFLKPDAKDKVELGEDLVQEFKNCKSVVSKSVGDFTPHPYCVIIRVLPRIFSVRVHSQ